MAMPDPTPGEGVGHGAPSTTLPLSPRARGDVRLFLVLALLAVAGPGGAGLASGAESATPPAGGVHRRAVSDEEITALWEARPPRAAAHRGYIFIDEEDIVDVAELPLFRIEGSRYGPLRSLERMTDGDPGQAARIADLAPELARETEMMLRADRAFYSRRSAAARRDTPDHPDVVAGPILSLFGRGR